LSPGELLQILAGLAGFGALAYGVGAAIMWIRFATTGFPADVGLATVPQARLVALGARSLLVWSALVLAAVGITVAISKLLQRRRGAPGVEEAQGISRRLGGRALLIGTLVGAAVAIGAAFVTWSAFTIALALLATFWFVHWYRPLQAAMDPAPRWPLVLFIALTSAAISIGWQLQVNLPYDHAILRLKHEPRDPRTGEVHHDGIYFGEAQGSVYFSPRVDRRVPEEGPPSSLAFERSIGVYPKEKIATLEILPEEQTLCTEVPRPASSFGRAVDDAIAIIDQHLSETGQRPPEIEEEPTAPLPQGACPSQ
jgi:hypothetical protein